MYNQNSENHIENKNLFDERLDIKSPYIKTGDYNLDEVRGRIAKRAYSNGENTDILDVKDKKESDSLLNKKIDNTVKRIAGAEIKKFAEVAGKEISKEFDNLEMRLEEKLDYIEQNTFDHFSIQKEALSKLEMSFSERLEKEMYKLNSTIEEMEKRIKDLEIFSLSNQNNSKNETISEKNIFNIKENKLEEKNTYNEYEFKIETLEVMKNTLKEEMGTENTLNNTILEEYSDEKELENEINSTNQNEYINNEIKKISNLFEKEGLLFKKNTFLSTIKNLNIKKIKENKVDLNIIDKEKIIKIITDLEEETKIQASKRESVAEFLERAFRIKFLNKK